MRDRVEAAAVDEAGAGPLRLGVVLDPHPVDELGLAGEVDVVGAGGGAGGDQRPAVERVGADGGDHDPGRRGDLGERGGVGGVGLEQVGRRDAARRARPSSAATASSLARLRPTSAQRASGGACAPGSGRSARR